LSVRSREAALVSVNLSRYPKNTDFEPGRASGVKLDTIASLHAGIEEVEIMSDTQAVDSVPPASVWLDRADCMNPPPEDLGSDGDLAPLNPGIKNLNPAGIGFLALLGEDLRTYEYDLTDPGLWAVAIHRFGNWRMSIRPRLLRLPFSLAFRFLSRLAELIGGIHLPYTTQLGRRVRIWHHGGIVLHARSIGNDVHIRQNTTFGIAVRDKVRAIPTIEDRVDIGCGACVLGAVTIGHDSRIGANAVVLTDIRPYSTAVGVPARVVKQSAPEGYRA
jgi:serine O-acetyltransferase